MNGFGTVVGAGLALGGVLALAASWSRGARTGWLPVLVAGAVPAVGATIAVRLAEMPVPFALLAATVAGGACGAASVAFEQRLAPSWLPTADVAALAVVFAVEALFAPPLGAPVARTLLGGAWPQFFGGEQALLYGSGIAIAGLGAALLLARVSGARLSLSGRWLLAGAGSGLLGAMASWTAGAALLARPEPLVLAVATAAIAIVWPQPSRAAVAGVCSGVVIAVAAWLGVQVTVLLGIGVVLVAALLSPWRMHGAQAPDAHTAGRA